MFRLLNMDLASKILRLLDLPDQAITQPDLVRCSGASKSVVSQWKNGQIKKVDFRFAMNLWRNLDINPWWLINDEGPMFVPYGTMPEQQTSYAHGKKIVALPADHSDALPGVDYRKLEMLSPPQRRLLAATLLAAAADLSVDIKSLASGKQRATTDARRRKSTS